MEAIKVIMIPLQYVRKTHEKAAFIWMTFVAVLGQLLCATPWEKDLHAHTVIVVEKVIVKNVMLSDADGRILTCMTSLIYLDQAPSDALTQCRSRHCPWVFRALGSTSMTRCAN